ncbi:uncharacterized protein LOC143860284 [Tasmannia lanceolata]|uniref:uncharacterized protein LOC143860284 n=1 Tax=Tasmannia lanceolata TaxID=3420 RepID=UPI0040628E51
MGSVLSKRNANTNENSRGLRERIRFLEEEVSQMRCKEEGERRGHEQQASVLVAKEAEWKSERKRWKDEVGRLRNNLQDNHRLEEKPMVTMGKGDKEWELMGANFVLEQMMEEQALREEAIQKWKGLYLAIKGQLVDLINRTHQGDRLWWGPEDEVNMEGLQRELKSREETVEALKEQLLAMVEEGGKREREVDILRQSLRIMISNKSPHIGKNLPQNFKFNRLQSTKVNRNRA